MNTFFDNDTILLYQNSKRNHQIWTKQLYSLQIAMARKRAGLKRPPPEDDRPPKQRKKKKKIEKQEERRQSTSSSSSGSECLYDPADEEDSSGSTADNNDESGEESAYDPEEEEANDDESSDDIGMKDSIESDFEDQREKSKTKETSKANKAEIRTTTTTTSSTTNISKADKEEEQQQQQSTATTDAEKKLLLLGKVTVIDRDPTYEGIPPDKLPEEEVEIGKKSCSWPTGWIKRTYLRNDGVRKDSCWYSPGGLSFRSISDVRRFIKACEVVKDHSEEMAKYIYKHVKVPTPKEAKQLGKKAMIPNIDQVVNKDGIPIAPSAPQSTTTRKKKKKAFDLSKDIGISTAQRLTSKGGYAHTQASRARISAANSGNEPWNKGKNRSSADRAKISAGVRARNRAILLEKLKHLGMTEEEYQFKQREIKKYRELLYKVKAKNDKQKLVDVQRKIQVLKDATQEKEETKPKSAKEKAAYKKRINARAAEILKREEDLKRQQEQVTKKAFKARAIKWTPFYFKDDTYNDGQSNIDNNGDDENDNGGDNNNNKQQEQDRQQLKEVRKLEQESSLSYKEVCPTGGPGGLICCEHCSQKYSTYLNRMSCDMEIQKRHKCGKQIEELMTFLEQSREELDQSMIKARQIIPIRAVTSLLPQRQPNGKFSKDTPAIRLYKNARQNNGSFC